MASVFDNYECDGQTDIFDFLKMPKGYFKCDTCVFYNDRRVARRKGERPIMTCYRADDPLKEFNPVTECDKYKPRSSHFKCCETCKHGNCFCVNNCWLFDKEGQEMPNRHHRDGFPQIGNGYNDNHEWDICDSYEQRNKKDELL